MPAKPPPIMAISILILSSKLGYVDGVIESIQ